MAELTIGEHCSIEDCKQLDFLPCVCNGCGRVFCKIHMCYEAHNCARNDLVATDNVILEGVVSYPCSLANCKQRELVLVACEHCGKNFCLKHRHQVDHKCLAAVERKERMTETARHVQEIISKSQENQSNKDAKKKPVSERSRALAAKVALMKMKQKAVGETRIPDADRVYFEVTLPMNHHSLQEDRRSTKLVQCALYFDRNWPVGRAIDYIASSKGLTNNNNKGDCAKLRLFDSSTGSACPSSRTFSSLINDPTTDKTSAQTVATDSSGANGDTVLFNGGSLLLEYVKDDVFEINI